MSDNAGLMAMLANAKKVMDKAEEKKPLISKHTVNEPTYEEPVGITESYEEEEVNFLTEEEMMRQAANSKPKTMGIPPTKIINGKGHYKNLEKSKIPEAIKKAMIETPIEQLTTPNHTFSLDDVAELVTPSKKKAPKRKRQISEGIKTKDLVGLSEAQVKKIVDDRIVEFFTKYFVKNLTEDVQRKVLKEISKKSKR